MKKETFQIKCTNIGKAELMLLDSGYVEHPRGNGWIYELPERKRWHAIIDDRAMIHVHKDITEQGMHRVVGNKSEVKREKDRIKATQPKQQPPQKKVKRLKPIVYNKKYPFQELKRKLLNTTFIIKLRRLFR